MREALNVLTTHDYKAATGQPTLTWASYGSSPSSNTVMCSYSGDDLTKLCSQTN